MLRGWTRPPYGQLSSANWKQISPCKWRPPKPRGMRRRMRRARLRTNTTCTPRKRPTSPRARPALLRNSAIPLPSTPHCLCTSSVKAMEFQSAPSSPCTTPAARPSVFCSGRARVGWRSNSMACASSWSRPHLPSEVGSWGERSESPFSCRERGTAECTASPL